MTSIPARTRSRQQCVTTLQDLVRLLEVSLPYDLTQYRGNYSQKAVKAIVLPDDQEIIERHALIPTASWRFVYGVMATFGVRPHEAFLANFSDLVAGGNTIQVSNEAKTGAREVWAFLPEWIDGFELRQPLLPQLTWKTPSDLGRKIWHQMAYSYKLPWKPYALRHRWAIRTMEIGLPISLVARQMGHALEVHYETYHAWINRQDQQKIYERILSHKQW